MIGTVSTRIICLFVAKSGQQLGDGSGEVGTGERS